jgi:lipopolysaccharide transport system permease protein
MNMEIRYIPSGPLQEGIPGPFQHIVLMFQELLNARELTWRLFLRDFSARYRQSVLGVAWAILMPMATAGVLIILNRAGVLEIGEVSVPYPIFALLGLTAWNLFAGGITAASSSIINAGSMVVKINFPKISLVIAAVGQAIVNLFIMIILLATAFVWNPLNYLVNGVRDLVLGGTINAPSGYFYIQ